MIIFKNYFLNLLSWPCYFKMNFFDQNSAPAISGNFANYAFRSITPAFTGMGCVLCNPPQSAQLALRSDISKLDCNLYGTKNRSIPLPLAELGLHSCVWAHFEVEEPCNSVTEKHFDFYCYNFCKPM